jgi:hypothetical protein
MRSDLGSLRSASEDAPLGERAATTLDLRSLAQGGTVRLPCLDSRYDGVNAW